MLELLQLRPRVEPELLGQLVLDPLVRREGVRLAAGSVQRGDQQLPQALLERVRRDRCLQLADHVGDISEPQPRGELDLEELHPRLLEPGAVRVDPFAIACCLEHVPAVQLQRRRTQVRGSAVVAGLEQTRRGGHHAQRGDRVDVGRLDGERVPAIPALDHRWIPERPAQHGDLRLQRVAPSAAPAR